MVYFFTQIDHIDINTVEGTMLKAKKYNDEM